MPDWKMLKKAICKQKGLIYGQLMDQEENVCAIGALIKDIGLVDEKNVTIDGEAEIGIFNPTPEQLGKIANLMSSGFMTLRPYSAYSASAKTELVLTCTGRNVTEANDENDDDSPEARREHMLKFINAQIEKEKTNAQLENAETSNL